MRPSRRTCPSVGPPPSFDATPLSPPLAPHAATTTYTTTDPPNARNVSRTCIAPPPGTDPIAARVHAARKRHLMVPPRKNIDDFVHDHPRLALVVLFFAG